MPITGAVGAVDTVTQGIIPSLFASDFNVRFYEGSLIPRTSTTRLVKELVNVGTEITIANLPNITFRNYTRNGTLTNEAVDSTPVKLTVNRAKYFSVALDPVDQKESHLNIKSKYLDTAMKQWDETVNTDYLASIYTEAHASNTGNTAGAIDGGIVLGSTATPLAFTTENAVDVLTRGVQVIGEQKGLNNKQQMWCVVPWAIRQRIVNSDLKAAFMTGDSSSVVRTGSIGKLDGVMEVMTSNLVHSATINSEKCYYCPFGTMDAIAFVQQLQKVSIIEGEKNSGSFETLLRGLMVYDWKVIKPEALGYFVIYAD